MLNDGLPYVHGLPISVRIGEDLIRSMPRFQDWYRSNERGSEVRVRQFDHKVGFHKVELMPKEVAKVSQAALRPHALVDEVQFVAAAGDSADISAKEEKVKALMGNVLNQDPALPDFWNDGTARVVLPTNGIVESLCRLPWRKLQGPDFNILGSR